VEHYLESLRSLLSEIHPLAPWLALALVPWAAVYVVRKCFPGIWLWLESWGPKDARASRVFLALPAVITTAALAAIGAGHDPRTFVEAACVAAIAPLMHHALKASPLPYKGELGDPPSKPPPGAGLLFICLMFLPGCVGTRTPAEEATRQGCLLKAEWASEKRAKAECPDSWDQCEHRADIMAELAKNQEACR